MAQSWQQEAVLRREYIERGKSTTEVANDLGCSRATILRWLDKHGIDTRPQHGFADERLRDAEKMRELYLEQELSCSDIGSLFDCGEETVRNWLEKHNIERRDAGGQHQTPKRLRQKDWLLGQYNDKGKSVSEIAEIVGCGTTPVRRWLKRYGAEFGPETFPSGEEHPNWKEDTEDLFGENWSQQREKALKRDGRVCQRCGMGNEEHREEYESSLHVHHITPRAEYECVEESNEVQNLITLCVKCHRMLEGIPIDQR